MIALLAAVALLDLLRAAMDPTPALRSYVATATLVAQARSPVPIRQTLHGTAYYERRQRAVVFERVPRALAQFRQLTMTIPSYADAVAAYRIEPGLDDGRSSSYTLVPRAPGRLTSIALTVDDAERLVGRVTWTYSDGSRLTVRTTYIVVDGNHVPASEDVAARFTGAVVDATMTFSDYRLNADVPAGIFSPAP
jgi:hypothetical protein